MLHCPYCHGYEVRDGALGVLATQARSVKQALLLRDWSDDVVLFEHTYGLSDLERAQLAARGVPVVTGEVTELVAREDRLCGVRTHRRAVRRHPHRAVRRPGASPAATEPLIDARLRGGRRTAACWSIATGAASVHGVWAAGNVVAPHAQVLTAAGAAAQAAIALHQDLVREDVEHAMRASSGRLAAPAHSA